MNGRLKISESTSEVITLTVITIYLSTKTPHPHRAPSPLLTVVNSHAVGTHPTVASSLMILENKAQMKGCLRPPRGPGGAGLGEAAAQWRSAR